MQVNLSKLKPCNQYWEEMTPDEDGRLCNKCNKHIVDFRKMSDFDVAFRHTDSEEPICGLYSEEQLSQSILNLPESRINSFRKLYFALTASLLSYSFAEAHQVSVVQPSYENILKVVENRQSKNKETLQEVSKRAAVADSLFVRGKVFDATTKQPLPGANIFVKGTQLGAATDVRGEYFIDLTSLSAKGEEITLVVSFIGFSRTEIRRIKLAKSITKLDVSLKPDEWHGTVFYVVAKKPSFLKRVWNGIKSIF